MVTADEVPNLRVVDLKAELKARDLPIAGLKAALADRLIEALKAEGSPQGNGAEEAAPAKETDAAQPAAEPATAAADDTAGAATAPSEPEPAAEEPAAEEKASSKTAEAAAPEAEAEPAAAEPQPTAEAPASTAEGAQPGEVAVGSDQPDDSRAAEVEPSAVSLTAGEAAAAKQSPADDAVGEAAAAKPPAGGPAEDGAAPAAEAAAQPADTPATEVASAPAAAEPATEPAVQPVVAVAADAAAADAAEPMIEDEAPEMDFDVEPEEEPAAAPAKPAEEARAGTKTSTGKRERDSIPGFKAPPKVDTARRDSSDARPSKAMRGEANTPGSAATRRLSSQNDIPLLTPTARSNVKVPPPNMKPTPALRIDGFMRPFNLQQVKALLSQEGAVIREEKGFWLSSIKTHCYVIYETAEQAEAIRQATFNIQWPRDNNKRLAPKFVTVEEAEGVIMGIGVGTPRASAATAAAAAPAATPGDSPRGADARRDILERRQQRSVKRAAPPPAEPTLDDLFRKTETSPHLYWLPVQKPAADKPAAGTGTPVANGI